MKIYYVVQPFEAGVRNRLRMCAPIQVKDEERALMTGDEIARRKAGAIVYAQSVDPDLGDVGDPIVLGTFGVVPEEALASF